MQMHDLMHELRTLELTLASKTKEIETKIDRFDDTRKNREYSMKSLVLKEIKKILLNLSDVDKMLCLWKKN